MDPTSAGLADLRERACPVCGSTDDSDVLAESNVDAEALGSYAFASRKEPELMHHRLVLCPVCDLLYASPAPGAMALAAEYERAAYDSGEEARHAARTYTRLIRALMPRLPVTGPALDIGAGDGAVLNVLLELGFEDVAGVEPSAAPVAAAPPRLRQLIRTGVFDPAEFEEGTFRLITVLMTLEHVAEPLELCRAAARLLVPGGALLLVCHDRRAPANRAMGMRSPIIDVEHLQIFSRPSLRQVLVRAGLERPEVRRFTNRYPLRYWLRLAPLPARARMVAAADRLGLGRLPLSLPVGNLAAAGFRPRL